MACIKNIASFLFLFIKVESVEIICKLLPSLYFLELGFFNSDFFLLYWLPLTLFLKGGRKQVIVNSDKQSHLMIDNKRNLQALIIRERKK